ncbi:MAG: hypothetical protein IBJ10_08100, partial [Phycisphaerales bacterium]|nr:hypothetical protein [Phycisphaerales bacterium]
MRCRTCNYVLWRLRARTCPECGAGFLPSEYEFERNSVRFRCPHCSQEYYGTDAQGLLTPRAFECVRCAAAIQMDEMVLEPAAGLPDESPYRANPWLDPRRQNRLMRWLRTVGMSLGRPAELARGTPDGRHGRALWFAVRSNVSYALIGWIVPFVLLGVVMTGLFAQSGGPFSGVWWVAGVLFAWVAGTLVVGVAALGVWALAAHGLLRVTGGTERRVGGAGDRLFFASGGPRVLGRAVPGAVCGAGGGGLAPGLRAGEAAAAAPRGAGAAGARRGPRPAPGC